MIKTYTFGDKLIKSSYEEINSNTYDMELCKNTFVEKLNDGIIAWCHILSNVVDATTQILLVTKEFSLIQTVDKPLSREETVIPAVMNFLSSHNNGHVTNTLIEKNLQISTMESCTSGLIASNITDYEGASAILKGASITYSNEAKIMAGVPASVIDSFGVYSGETAAQMARVTKERFSSDIGIGITGSFSNVDPNNKDSIAGVVYFQILFRDNENPIKLIYHNLDISRKEIKQKTVDIVLSTLSVMLP